MSQFLLINNNNTRTKFGLANSVELLDNRAIKTSEVSLDSIAEATRGWDYDKVAIASVVPRDLPVLLESQEKASPPIIVSHLVELGVTIDFPRPASVGADRLANAAAVADSVQGRPCIVVDFGTALTFDIVDPRPAYIGGVIAPGLDSMTSYLHHRTALLPKISIERPDSAIGKSTEQAMMSGAFHGYRGLVTEIIHQIESELGASARIIATGGYAELLATDLSRIEEVSPFLTMEGIRKIALLNA